MLSDKLKKALNEQVTAEMESFYVYLGMAAYFDSLNLKGFAHWMHMQAAEEQNHAIRFYTYLYDRGARVELLPIGAPPAEWESPLAVFENALAHERKISGMIHNLMDLAIEDKDHPTQAFLHWFVNEQVEEEATADDIVQRLKFIGDEKMGVYMIDQEMAQRQPEAGGAE